MDRETIPSISETDAERLVHEHYGFTGSAVFLVGEYNRNFRIEVKNGTQFVLKVSPEPRQALELQGQALEYLAVRDFPCPAVQRTRRGDSLWQLHDAKGALCHGWMLSYLPGQLWAQSARSSAKLREDLGLFLGKLDGLLLGFSHPAARRTLRWDLKNASMLRDTLDSIPELHRRALVDRLLRRFSAFVEPVFSELRSSVIHNDANDHNVLVSPSRDGGEQLSGIIDFGDMVHTATVCELAIGASYALLHQVDPLAAASSVVRGYHQVFPLQEQELEVLFHLICTRLAVSACISSQRKLMAPGNQYLQISAQPVWAALEKLSAIDSGAAIRVFREACGFPVRKSSLSRSEILEIRRRHLGRSLSLSYRVPLNIVRGSGPYLFDAAGRAYLDLVNNVCHVGHCHPQVVEAAQRQIRELNTNTRYLHSLRARYVERLAALFPEPLQVCILVCTGSEANDLALRMARAHTRGRDVIVVRGAYHGNTTALIEISPYKFDGLGGEGAPLHVHTVETPGNYRGCTSAADVGRAVRECQQQGRGLAAFFCESLMGVAGQLVLPPGYLECAYEQVRGAGGICVADEVQVGFGRVGSHMWGFQTQGVVPDIVTLGKPMGNGHPLAAVITTAQIAASFDNGMEYFNTYGGNPVSCAIGMAVLDVLEAESLQENALRVGAHLMKGLKELQKKHTVIGDVRGLGLFLGVELVEDRSRKAPAARAAAEISE
ncbi:MAG: aminotransferase class III-fold pyridoxal phosphate-dependent enzyme, partial [Planctomycetota bacterium]